MFGIGGSQSTTRSTSDAQSTDVSSSFGQSSQGVFGADLFQQLYGDAFDATGKIATNLPTYQGDAATLFSGGTDFLKQLSGGDAGSDYLTSRLGADDPLLNEQIGGLSSDLSKFYKEQLLPGITSEGVQSGMLGGGREGVAQGAAAGEVARQFTQGVTQLRTGAQAQRDAAASTLMTGRTNAAGVGLSGLNNVLGISQAGLSADILPQQLLAQILGEPTTLTDSLQGSSAVGQSTAKSKSKGSNAGFNFSTGGPFGG